MLQMKSIFTCSKYIARVCLILMIISLFLLPKHHIFHEKIVHMVTFLYHFVLHNWVWFILFMIIPFFTKSFYKWDVNISDEIRLRILKIEIERYLNTPYIAPLHLLYMLQPPRWLKNEYRFPFQHPLYIEAAQAFSEIVYFKFEFKLFEPKSRVPFFKTVSKHIYLKLLLCLGTIVIGTPIIIMSAPLTNAYTVLLLPFILKSCIITGLIIKALYKYGRYSKLEKQITNFFGEPNPKVTWLELYPNTAAGQKIILTWKSEVTLRQVRERAYRQNHMNLDLSAPKSYDQSLRNPAPYDMKPIPPCPFPSEQVPNWFNAYTNYSSESFSNESVRELELVRKIVSESNGKVVDFNSYKKKSNY